MSKQDREEQLPEPFEAMLGAWPVGEREDGAWEESAKSIEGRLAAADSNEDSAALVAAPLPPEAGEPGFAKEPAADDAPPRSLADLARSLAAEKPKEEANDIALESLSLANSARASAPAIADAVRAEAAQMAAAAATRISAPPPVSVQGTPGAGAPPVDLARRRSAAGPLAMAAIGLVGLAAAAAIVVRAQRQAEPAAVAAATVSPAAEPAAATQPAASAAGDDIVALDDLAQGNPEAVAGRPQGGEKLALKGAEAKPEAAPKAGSAEPAPEPPAAPVAKQEDKKDDEAAKMKPAATAGDLPDKPSTGAVQAAIGSVMGSARACVAGQDEASRATITFGADGRVKSVGVSGKAAGTPAEACIKAALGKARVQPFARPSFSVGSAVRP
ncbi:MAG: hypothetical protein IPI67_12510 [Myxococcales bacterium]|nr:hypothetical protein [Myxococcales bacterium]